jgi:AmiR/NasT family two-component response regulator
LLSIVKLGEVATPPLSYARIVSSVYRPIASGGNFSAKPGKPFGAYSALNSRKIIEQAKGILMRKFQLDEAEAYKRLRRLAMNQGKKLADVAHLITQMENL